MTGQVRRQAKALSRLGVSIDQPWWRRRLQSRFAPRRYRLWVQFELLRVLGGAMTEVQRRETEEGARAGMSRRSVDPFPYADEDAPAYMTLIDDDDDESPPWVCGICGFRENYMGCCENCGELWEFS